MSKLTANEAILYFSLLYKGEHHIPRSGLTEYNGCWSVCDSNDMSTWDYDFLTRLVLLSHKYAIRTEIRPAMRYIRIIITKRDPTSKNIFEGHPTLTDLAERCKSFE
jgi:hypothetical protein